MLASEQSVPNQTRHCKNVGLLSSGYEEAVVCIDNKLIKFTNLYQIIHFFGPYYENVLCNR